MLTGPFYRVKVRLQRRKFSEQARNQHRVHLWPKVEHFPRFFLLWIISIKTSNKLSVTQMPQTAAIVCHSIHDSRNMMQLGFVPKVALMKGGDL